uniref:Opa interacting protein 5 n=1 Tax=Nothoprocta perdicaria TaxID=30464 RepID=A0A8C6YX56_NOTPE
AVSLFLKALHLLGLPPAGGVTGSTCRAQAGLDNCQVPGGRPPPPPAPPAPTAPQPRRRGPRPEECAVFQCRACRAVLGDSLHLCAAAALTPPLFAGVTGDVAREEPQLIGLEGALLGCTFNALSCRACGLTVGFVLYSAFSDLAYLRGFFCFFKDKKLVTVHMRLELLMKKLEELNQKSNVAEKHSAASDAAGFTAGYAKVKNNN